MNYENWTEFGFTDTQQLWLNVAALERREVVYTSRRQNFWKTRSTLECRRYVTFNILVGVVVRARPLFGPPLIKAIRWQKTIKTTSRKYKSYYVKGLKRTFRILENYFYKKTYYLFCCIQSQFWLEGGKTTRVVLV